MSLDGSANYFPLTINGLQEISADSSSVTTLQVNSLTPNRVVVSDGSNYLVSAGVTTTEVDYLLGTSSNVQSQLNARATTSYVDTNFLNKTTSSDQTVAGKVTYTKELVVSDEKVANLASKVVVDANYQNLITSANVSVSQNFGTITNALGVYQSTTNTSAGTPILIFFPITNTKRYRFTVEVLVEDTGATWYVAPFQSVDNVNPVTYGLLPFTVISANTSVYTLVDLSFEAVTTGNVVVSVESDLGAGNDKAFKWKNLTVYEEGVALTNVSMPAQLADRVVVLNDKKQLVSSGISTTKLGYLDNVSSDIQTQLNNRLTLSGSNANQDIVIGAYKVQSSATPSTGNDYTNKTYVDGVISGLSSVYVLKSGDTMTGALTVNAAVNVGNRFLGTPDSSPSGNFWMGLRGTGTEVDRLAISIAGNSTTGVVSGVYIPKVLYLQSASATTAFQVFSTQSNHYDGTASTTYLMSGIDGYLTIAKKTTQSDTEACLMLGTDNDISELVSTTTDGSGVMPLRFRGEKYSFITDEFQNIGYVGIGTTTPLASLHIYKASNYPEVYIDYGTGQKASLATGNSGSVLGYSGYLEFGTITGAQLANFSEKMRLTSGGNLGVNQSNPQWRIHANRTNAWDSTTGGYAANKAQGILALGGKDNDPDYQYLIFPNPSQTDGGVPGMSWWSPDMILGRYKNEYRLAWWKETHGSPLGTSYEEGITLYLLDSPGGFTTLDYIKLNGNTTTNGVGTFTQSGRGWIHNNGTVRLESYIDGSGGWLGTYTSHPLFFYTANSNQLMTLDTSGRLGIGITTPSYKLDVNGGARMYSASGSDYLTLHNTTYTDGQYINFRFNHADTRNCYIQSYLYGPGRSWLKFFNSDSGGNVGERLRIQDDWSVFYNGLYVVNNFFRESNPTTTNNTYNNTITRLMFREGDGYVRHGDCSTWTYRNNSVAWTGGLILNNSLYRVSASSTIIFTIQGSWWATSGGNKDFIIELWSGPVQPFVGTLKVYTSVRKYFNITGNHETITIPITYTSSELGATTGWYSFYFYAGGGGITSDSNDTIWWSAQIIG